MEFEVVLFLRKEIKLKAWSEKLRNEREETNVTTRYFHEEKIAKISQALFPHLFISEINTTSITLIVSTDIHVKNAFNLRD